MISEMQKVRNGRIRRILARGATWVKVAYASISETTWVFDVVEFTVATQLSAKICQPNVKCLDLTPISRCDRKSN
jgi:hypothetical protein